MGGWSPPRAFLTTSTGRCGSTDVNCFYLTRAHRDNIINFWTLDLRWWRGRRLEPMVTDAETVHGTQQWHGSSTDIRIKDVQERSARKAIDCNMCDDLHMHVSSNGCLTHSTYKRQLNNYAYLPCVSSHAYATDSTRVSTKSSSLLCTDANSVDYKWHLRFVAALYAWHECSDL